MAGPPGTRLEFERSPEDLPPGRPKSLLSESIEFGDLADELVDELSSALKLAHLELRRRIDWLEARSRELSDGFETLELRNTELACLHVVSCRLQEAFGTTDVVEAIAEIVANLVGCEEMALFGIDTAADQLELIGSRGIDERDYGQVPVDDPIFGGVLNPSDPYPRYFETPDHPVAVIPLVARGELIGALVLFRLLPQRQSLGETGRRICEVLASHGSKALYAARLEDGRPQPARVLQSSERMARER